MSVYLYLFQTSSHFSKESLKLLEFILSVKLSFIFGEKDLIPNWYAKNKMFKNLTVASIIAVSALGVNFNTTQNGEIELAQLQTESGSQSDSALN